MIGHVVQSSGISYSERHSIEPDGRIPERFGKPLEIPEDLMPIPEERPGVLQSTHPLAKYVHLVCYKNDGSKELFVPSGVFFVDGAKAIIARITAMSAKAADAHGALPTAAEQYAAIEITYDESAIDAENERRLKKALEIAGYYQQAISAHQDRYLERARKRAEQLEGTEGSWIPTQGESPAPGQASDGDSD